MQSLQEILQGESTASPAYDQMFINQQLLLWESQDRETGNASASLEAVQKPIM